MAPTLRLAADTPKRRTGRVAGGKVSGDVHVEDDDAEAAMRAARHSDARAGGCTACAFVAAASAAAPSSVATLSDDGARVQAGRGGSFPAGVSL